MGTFMNKKLVTPVGGMVELTELFQGLNGKPPIVQPYKGRDLGLATPGIAAWGLLDRTPLWRPFVGNSVGCSIGGFI